MSIDRTTAGSYGTVTIQYDNPYLMVFDEIKYDFVSNDYVGLIEEASQEGWRPRTFLVANAGLMPAQFNAIYDSAFSSLQLSLVGLLIMLTYLTLL